MGQELFVTWDGISQKEERWSVDLYVETTALTADKVAEGKHSKMTHRFLKWVPEMMET